MKNANQKSDTYTMPLRQLLKLLETTADDVTRPRKRPRRRADAKPAAPDTAEPEYFRPSGQETRGGMR